MLGPSCPPPSPRDAQRRDPAESVARDAGPECAAGLSRRRRTFVMLAMLLQASPAAAVVGPSRDMPSFTDRVVMVLQRRGSAAGFCTGVVVAARAVLTAAHCVPPGADLRIHYRDDAGKPVLLPVADVTRHPGYRPDAVAKRERSIDLAVVHLAEPLPERFRPAAVATIAGTEPGTAFRVFGFGVAHEGDGASSGTLREADLVARTPLSGVLLWAEDPRHRGAGACTGDSGGPVFGADGDAVAALTLWAAGDGSRQCGALTQAIWLAPYREWIVENTKP